MPALNEIISGPTPPRRLEPQIRNRSTTPGLMLPGGDGNSKTNNTKQQKQVVLKLILEVGSRALGLVENQPRRHVTNAERDPPNGVLSSTNCMPASARSKQILFFIMLPVGSLTSAGPVPPSCIVLVDFQQQLRAGCSANGIARFTCEASHA